MKKTFHLSVLALTAVLALSACSSSNGENNKPDGSNSGGETPKQVTLKLGLPGSYDVTSKEIVDGFIASHPNIKVEIQEAPWGDFTSKIATQIAGNTMPDVWLQENAVILGYGKRGVAEDLSPFIEKDLKADDYIDGLFAAKATDGKVYGVPHGINPIALAYNKKVFDDAGVPAPTDDWTYQDLIDASKKLTKKNEVYGFVGAYSITQGWFPWIKQAGGYALDETLTKAMFSDPKSITGLTQLVDGVKDGYFTNPDFLTVNGGELQTFAAGKAAMYFMQYSSQVSMNSDFPDTDWDVVKIPKAVDGKRYVPMVTNSWLISSRAKQESKDAAWEFLKYYLGDEAQKIVADSGSTLPVKKTALDSLDQSTTKPANKKAFTEGIAEGGVTLDENASWSEWRIIVQQYVNELAKGNGDAQSIAKEIDKKVQEVLDSNQ
ncbi:ABC transporter substrate-binding protein [Paenibacillus nasutitermitis]|uniref:Sugar ABC transporter substrate-binding protein n=1 Tax=Paenibacillus nasutitermitis TaxID=1652958 RepID=A0A916Z9L6_9BACL|nr:sugar ABC transporter substrate-binding protein [Paenibacillus nasutitermitis]GGD82979.1 sugar ABC transporter substrate-binding protein [Paenibacillus nasutitermitis]